MEKERPAFWTFSASWNPHPPFKRTPWTCWSRAALRSLAGVRNTRARWDEPPRGHRPPLQLRKTVSHHVVPNLSPPVHNTQEVMKPSSTVCHDSAVCFFLVMNCSRGFHGVRFRNELSTRCFFPSQWFLKVKESMNWVVISRAENYIVWHRRASWFSSIVECFEREKGKRRKWSLDM